MGLAQQLVEVTDGQGLHDQLRGGLGLAHLGGAQLDVGAGGGAEDVDPGQDAHAGDGAGDEEHGDGAAQDLAQALHVHHAAHGGGDGHEHQGHHDGEQQVQEDVADGLELLTEGGRDDTDDGTDGDTAEEQDRHLVLLPEGFFLHSDVSFSVFSLFYGFI